MYAITPLEFADQVKLTRQLYKREPFWMENELNRLMQRTLRDLGYDVSLLPKPWPSTLDNVCACGKTAMTHIRIPGTEDTKSVCPDCAVKECVASDTERCPICHCIIPIR